MTPPGRNTLRRDRTEETTRSSCLPPRGAGPRAADSTSSTSSASSSRPIGATSSVSPSGSVTSRRPAVAPRGTDMARVAARPGPCADLADHLGRRSTSSGRSDPSPPRIGPAALRRETRWVAASSRDPTGERPTGGPGTTWPSCGTTRGLAGPRAAGRSVRPSTRPNLTRAQPSPSCGQFLARQASTARPPPAAQPAGPG